MADAEDFLPAGYIPTEELMVEKAECSECGLKTFEDVRAWANAHVRATGHPVALTFLYDVRDEHWLERLPYERQAKIENLRRRP